MSYYTENILNELVDLGLTVISSRTFERLSSVQMMVLTTPHQSFIFWTGLHDGSKTWRIDFDDGRTGPPTWRIAVDSDGDTSPFTVGWVDDPTDLIDHALAEGWTETTAEF